MPDASVDTTKNAIREKVWALLEDAKVVEPGVRGHIPAFAGAEEAADRLAALPDWKAADVVKIVPDRAQLPVRTRALADGKLVYMAAPALAAMQPFYLLDPADLHVSPAEAADKDVAVHVGREVSLEEMTRVDLVVCGSVAVNRRGVRVGKGAGYSDIEVALLTEAGLLTDETTIITTAHSLQVIDDQIPETSHDFSVDVIVTQDEMIRCTPPRRPSEIQEEQLDEAMIAAIPVLARRFGA